MRPSSCRVLACALVALLVACAEPAPAPDPEVGVASAALEKSLLRCGLRCPSGYHPVDYGFSISCTGSSPTQVTCEPDAGTEFRSCGTTCPAGYHAEEFDSWPSCNLGGPSTLRNRTRCVVSTGPSFGTCGTSCPASHHPVWYFKRASCSLDGSLGLLPNWTQCDENVGASFLACGSTCPAGYEVVRQTTWSDCWPSSGNNQVECRRVVGGQVTVSPRTVVVAPGQTATVTVGWSTSRASSAELRATAPGQAERVLSTALSGQLSYGPIQAGERHTFRLFAGGVEVAGDSVVAVAPNATGTITASPQTVVATGATGTTTISWSTQNARVNPRVYVRVNGAAPSLFASGVSGSASATWIVPGNSYRFTLHEGEASAPELASVVVTGQAAVAIAPTPGPWWNPARSGNGLDLRVAGDTLYVTWLTYDPDGAAVWYLSALARSGAGYGGEVRRHARSGASAVVGTATITLTSADAGSLAYTVDGRSAVEPIEAFRFAGPASVPSLSGLWYAPSESGWGIDFDTQGTTHFAYVLAYAPDGRPTWTYGVAGGGETVVRFDLLATTGVNLCPGCTGPTSTSTATVGTLTVDTSGLGLGSLRVDLGWPWWPRTALVLNRLL